MVYLVFHIVDKYSEFAKNALKEKYAYRFRAIMWSCSALVSMTIQYFLWISIYKEVNGDFIGVNKYNYIVYITFGVMFYSLTSNLEYMNIASDIKSGNILMNLTKPINYKVMVFFRHLGGKIGDLIGLVPLLVLALILCQGYSLDWKTAILFAVSTVLAFIVSFLYAYIVGLLAFWTINFWGLHLMTGALMTLFSGQLIAINFYVQLGKGAADIDSSIAILHTQGFQVFFRILGYLSYIFPYQSIYYTPMSIFSKIIYSPKDIVLHIILQIFWIIILNIISKLLWNGAQKKITILGG